MKAVIAALIIVLAFASCGGYTTGTIQKSEKGFLKFEGNKEAVMISVDDGTRFPYDIKTDLYEVKPGKHTIKVYRGDKIVVDRIIIVDNQTIFEIEVP
jgi:hypothetical protein